MAAFLIACRSITYAQRAVHILNKAGIHATAKKLPMTLRDAGCGHAVRVGPDALERAKETMRESGFEIHKVYCEQSDGTVGECV